MWSGIPIFFSTYLEHAHFLQHILWACPFSSAHALSKPIFFQHIPYSNHLQHIPSAYPFSSACCYYYNRSSCECRWFMKNIRKLWTHFRVFKARRLNEASSAVRVNELQSSPSNHQMTLPLRSGLMNYKALLQIIKWRFLCCQGWWTTKLSIRSSNDEASSAVRVDELQISPSDHQMMKLPLRPGLMNYKALHQIIKWWSFLCDQGWWTTNLSIRSSNDAASSADRVDELQSSPLN